MVLAPNNRRWILPVLLGAAALAGFCAVVVANHGARKEVAAAPKPAAVTQVSSYEDLTHQAEGLIQSKGYPEATLLLNRAIQLDPTKPKAHDVLAQIELYVYGQLPAAIQNYKSVIAHGGAATFHVSHDHVRHD